MSCDFRETCWSSPKKTTSDPHQISPVAARNTGTVGTAPNAAAAQQSHARGGHGRSNHQPSSYPLVNIQKTMEHMEHSHLEWENSPFLWPFSIGMFIYHGMFVVHHFKTGLFFANQVSETELMLISSWEIGTCSTCWDDYMYSWDTLWQSNIAIDNGHRNVDLPMIHGDFP